MNSIDFESIIRFLNGILMIAVPIILGIYLVNKFRMSGKFILVGGAVFVISQVFHIPFNSYILNPILVKIQQTISGNSGTIIISLLLGLSAGVFESFARYIMYRWWLKDARSWRTGLLAGVGHGGMEAALLGILALIAFINMAAYRNLDLSNLDLLPEQLTLARQQIQAYWSLPWYEVLLNVIERVFAITFHIAASLLVLQVFTRKTTQYQHKWLGLAVLFHMLVDSSAVFLASQGNIYLAEVILGAMAILSVITIIALRKPDPESPTEPVSSPITRTPIYTPPPVEESSENLEKSRYQ